MRIFSVTLALLASMASNIAAEDATARNPKLIQQLIQLDRQWISAEISNDIPAIERLLSDDLMAVDSMGQRKNKAEYLADIQSGKIRWRTSVPDQYQVLVHGDVAIMTHRTKVDGTVAGNHVEGESRALHVWIKRNRRWQVAAQQITTIPAALNPAGQ